MKIAISGYGYAGKATHITLHRHSLTTVDIVINDPFKDMVVDDWKEIDIHFLAVPTPSTVESGYDLSAILDAVGVAKAGGFAGSTVVRSTIAPSDVSKIEAVLGHEFTQWPEFLREAHWKEDAENPSLTIFGGPASAALSAMMPGLEKTIVKDARHAVMSKLAINTTLAARTIIAHDLSKLCDAMGMDWKEIIWAMVRDPRVGASHWMQPGPDGQYGFGGSCFPKDTRAIAHELAEAKVGDDFASWILSKNKHLR